MSAERFFCALASQSNEEALCGTVARIRSWLLLEYPGVWRHDALEDSRLLSPEVKSRLRTLPVDRILMIRQEHQWNVEKLRVFSVASCTAPPTIDRYLIRDFEQLRSPLTGGERSGGLMFAVCTHGRHDKCCAKFGMPVWCALKELAPEQSWQCSHVGGDRFAANVVLFPHGIYYGRVRPDDVPELLNRSHAGEIWLPGYRGRSCYSRGIQTAEAMLRAESGRLRFDEFAPVGPPAINGEVTAVLFHARSDNSRHLIEFTTAASDFRQRLTCSTAEESSVPQHHLHRYTVLPAAHPSEQTE